MPYIGMRYSLLYKTLLRFFLLSILIAVPGWAADSSYSVVASPLIIVPVHLEDFDSKNDSFAPAFGGTLGLELEPRDSSPLYYRISAAYSGAGLLPIDGNPVNGSLNELSFLAGVGFKMNLLNRFSLFAYFDGGIVLGSLGGNESVPYGSLRLGTGIDLQITREFSARLEGSWTSRFGFYGGPGATLGVIYNLPASDKKGIDTLSIPSFNLNHVFPMFKSFYDDHPMGTVSITNTGKVSVKDISVNLFIRQYMDAPKECGIIEELAAGASVEVPLFGLFNDSILTVTEATKVSAEVTLVYGNGNMQSKTGTVLVYDRNALTWSDDRHAAAFVSSKDPWVLDLSGNITASIRDFRNPEVPANIQTAVAFHEGLNVYGLSYILSPGRSISSGTAGSAQVDSLKFPRQVLGARAGDCADLSVLYASFFEAAGIRTAFITVPGHIFMAFDSGLTPAEAAARAMDDREIIQFAGRVWIPVETTLRGRGFMEAWQNAATQWRQAEEEKLANFFPLLDAWELYPPVGLPSDGSAVSTPDAVAIKAAFVSEITAVAGNEMEKRIQRLGSSPSVRAGRFYNERGILYARYGKYEEAEKDFKKAVEGQHRAASMNLGNLAFLRNDYAAAYEIFSQASRQSPDNVRILISMAQAAAGLGRTQEVDSLISRARELDPGITERYASLSVKAVSGERAGLQAEEETLWF